MSGRLTPLRLFTGPPAITSASKLSSRIVVTRNTSLPSSISNLAPGMIAAKISGCGRRNRVLDPASSCWSKVTVSPASTVVPATTSPTRCFGPCRSARIQHGFCLSASRARMVLIRSPCSFCVPCEKFRRKTFTPASSRAARPPADSQADPTVARILVARTFSEVRDIDCQTLLTGGASMVTVVADPFSAHTA